MISEEQFVKRVFDNFDAIRSEISSKNAITQQKIQELCDRIQQTQAKYNELSGRLDTHLKIESEIEKYKKDAKEEVDKVKDRKTYLIVGVMTVAFAVYEAISLTLFR